MTPAQIPFNGSISFADLPQWSPWPARLTGTEPWSRPQRTAEDVEREYNIEKYGTLLAHLAEHPTATAAELKVLEFGGDMNRELCVTVGEELYKATLADAVAFQDHEMVRLLRPWMEQADVICDVGCGYGYHLSMLQQHFPDKTYWGGEFTSNAVAIAQKLYAEQPNISVEQLDMSGDFTLPFAQDERVLLMSFYALTCVPQESTPLQRLHEIKGNDWTVALFEPLLEHCSDSSLGLLRREYILRNNYKHDLYDTLVSNKDVEILQEEREFFGINPVFPASFVCWR